MFVRAFPSWLAKPIFIFGSGYIPTIFNVFDEMISATTTKYNDQERFKAFCGHYPASQSVYNWIDVARMSESLPERDLGSKQNLQVYGSVTPPAINQHLVNKSNMPIYLITAKHDNLVWPVYSRKTRETIKDRLIGYDEINGGHNVYFIGKDVSWSKNMIAHLDAYNK